MSDGLDGLDGLLSGLDGLDPESDTPIMDQEKMKVFMDQLKSQLAGVTAPGYAIHPAVYVCAFVILFSFLGLFSYKLIKSLTDKEKKREEKRRLKELKKKK